MPAHRLWLKSGASGRAIKFEKTPVHGHYQDKGHHSNKQPADECDSPQRDGLKEAAVLNSRYHFSR